MKVYNVFVNFKLMAEDAPAAEDAVRELIDTESIDKWEVNGEAVDIQFKNTVQEV